MMKKFNIICVAGTRPNFTKISSILRALTSNSKINPLLIHTGQHHDFSMSQSFFDELGISSPHVYLDAGSGSHAVITADIMKKFEVVLHNNNPSAVLVVGDVNSTLACALVAAKEQVPVIHVEAGLRSYDRKMPEEINRVLTDQISDLLFTTEKSAIQNLQRENIDLKRIHFVGNVMIDTLKYNLERAVPADETLKTLNFPSGSDAYGLLTLHRASNVDDPKILKDLLGAIVEISKTLPVIFPLHPRTKERVKQFSFEYLFNNSKIFVTEPLSYLKMLGLMAKAKLVLTDSGGIQEETTALGIPCFTLRENTERPITITEGTNTLVGISQEVILSEFSKFIETGGKVGRIPELWDGNAAERVCQHIVNWLI